MAFKPEQIKTPKEEKEEKMKASPGLAPSQDDLVEVEKAKITLEEERVYRKGVLSIQDVISPAGMKIESTFITLGDIHIRTLFIVTYPRYISLGWFAPIINMNQTLDVSMYFYPVKPEVILKQLKKKVGALEAQIMSDAEKGAPRDPLRETALRDIEALRDSLTQGTEHFFQFALYVTIYANDKKELD